MVAIVGVQFRPRLAGRHHAEARSVRSVRGDRRSRRRPCRHTLRRYLADTAIIIDDQLLRPVSAGKVGGAPMNPAAIDRTPKTAARRAA